MRYSITLLKSVPLVCCALFLTACSSTSGVTRTSEGNMVIHVTGDTGFITLSSLQEDVYTQARAFCSKEGKMVEEVDFFSDGGTFKYPKVSLTFKCI